MSLQCLPDAWKVGLSTIIQYCRCMGFECRRSSGLPSAINNKQHEDESLMSFSADDNIWWRDACKTLESRLSRLEKYGNSHLLMEGLDTAQRFYCLSSERVSDTLFIPFWSCEDDKKRKVEERCTKSPPFRLCEAYLRNCGAEGLQWEISHFTHWDTYANTQRHMEKKKSGDWYSQKVW